MTHSNVVTTFEKCKNELKQYGLKIFIESNGFSITNIDYKKQYTNHQVFYHFVEIQEVYAFIQGIESGKKLSEELKIIK